MHVTIIFLSFCHASDKAAASKHMVAVMYYHSNVRYEVDDEADVLKYSDSANIFCHIAYSNYL